MIDNLVIENAVLQQQVKKKEAELEESIRREKQQMELVPKNYVMYMQGDFPGISPSHIP